MRLMPILALMALAALPARAQVTSQRLEGAAAEPQNWMLYGGAYSNQRYSSLSQINQGNVKTLEQKWVVQNQVPGAWESNPLVVDGIMYLTERPNDAASPSNERLLRGS